jgi:hypothetical protein
MSECIIDPGLTCKHKEINGKLCSACEISSEKPVSLDEGKYTFYYENSIIKCKRHGEPWRDFLGDNAVFYLYLKCLELGRRCEGQAAEIDRLEEKFELYKFNTGE